MGFFHQLDLGGQLVGTYCNNFQFFFSPFSDLSMQDWNRFVASVHLNTLNNGPLWCTWIISFTRSCADLLHFKIIMGVSIMHRPTTVFYLILQWLQYSTIHADLYRMVMFFLYCNSLFFLKTAGHSGKHLANPPTVRIWSGCHNYRRQQSEKHFFATPWRSDI